MAEWMVGVDTGGTFTDLVAFAPLTGELRTIKVPSVPADPSSAVINALDELFRNGLTPREIGFLVHGTTVATNAVLESAGVRAGLLITRGFRAVYEARSSRGARLGAPRCGGAARLLLSQASAAGAAVAHRGDPGAHGLSGNRARTAGRAGRAGSGATAQGQGSPGGRCLLSVQLPQPAT